MPDEHWTTGFEHSSVTDENRQAFNTHMAKFPTQADAVADGYGLAQMKGKPFKFPESMEKLPDDASRADFTSQARKLLNITHAGSIEELVDLDLKAGAKGDVAMDETLAAAFKQFVVDKKIDKTVAQEIIGFHNTAMGTAREANATLTKTAADKAAAEHLAAARACNEALASHADFGSQEELDKQTVFLHRALADNIGISKERAEEIAVFMKDGLGSSDPVIRRAMLKTYAPLAAESTNEGPGKGTSPAAKVKSEQDKKVAKDLGWK